MRVGSVWKFTLAILVLGGGLWAKELIKVGVILPLTGNQSNIGEDVRNALSMKQDTVKTHQTKYDYQILFEDGQNLPRVSVEAFHKLVNIDEVKLIMTLYSGPGVPVSVIANNKGILHIGCAFSNDVARGYLNFNNFSRPEHSAQKLLDYLNAAGYKNVAIISQQQAGTNALEDAFSKKAMEACITLVAKEKFAPSERDFRVPLLRIRQAQPDVLLIHAFDPEASIIRRQMAQMGFNPPICAMGHWGAITQNTFDGIPYIEANGNETFSKSFKERFGHYPSYFAAYLTDSLSMFIDACESFPSTSIPSATYIANWLENVKDYQGVMGNLSCINHWFDSPPAIVIQTLESRHTVSLEEAVEIAHKKWGAPKGGVERNP